MKDNIKASPTALHPLVSNQAEAEALAIELAQGYIPNAALSLSMMEEFAYVDAEAWSQLDQSA